MRVWQGLKAHHFWLLSGTTEVMPCYKRRISPQPLQSCPREPVAHHGKTVPQRLKPIYLVIFYGTAEAMLFVRNSARL
jgi:hypothetical protein